MKCDLAKYELVTATIQSQLVEIGPELAKRIMQLNVNNRPKNAKNWAKLAEIMRSGLWKHKNGDSIRISKTGRLIDGQHRLEAVIQTGLSIVTFLITGLDDDSFASIDDGRKRTGADVMHIDGEKYCTSLTAAIRVAAKFGGWTKRADRMTNPELLSFLAEHGDIRRSVALCHSMKKLVPPGTLAGLHYLFALRDSSLADTFCRSLIDGTGLSKGSPVLTLRERLIRNVQSTAKITPEHVIALVIKSWNACRDGARLPANRLTWRSASEPNEAMPEIR